MLTALLNTCVISTIHPIGRHSEDRADAHDNDMSVPEVAFELDNPLLKFVEWRRGTRYDAKTLFEVVGFPATEPNFKCIAHGLELPREATSSLMTRMIWNFLIRCTSYGWHGTL